jgi:DNA-binding NarL/FixJ family response regulator
MNTQPIRVLCVDDNPLVAQGVQIKLAMYPGFEWVGHLHTADHLLDRVKRLEPHIVLLDIDMPGKDALTALREISEAVPGVRTIILSGYARDEYLDRAVESGAWGYVSKNDGPDEVVEAIRRAAHGHFAFGPSILQACGQASVSRAISSDAPQHKVVAPM